MTHLRGRTAFAGMIALIGLSPQVHAKDWSQVYISAGGGADAITGDVATTGVGPLSARGVPLGGDLGVRVGLGGDYQFSPWLVGGLFADVDRSNTSTGAYVHSKGADGSITVLSVGQNYALGGRLGVLVQPQTLVYALAGYSWLKLESDIPRLVNGPPVEFHSPLFHGWTLGGGLEHRLTDNLSLRGEYRFSQFDSENVISVDGNDVLSLQPRLHSGRISIAYRLDSDSTHAKQPRVPRHNQSWTGLYLGGHLGVEALTRDLNLTLPQIPATAGLTGVGGGGLNGGLDVGFDYNINRDWLLGVLAGVDWSSDISDITIGSGGTTGTVSLLGLENAVTIAGRVGYLLQPDSLIYGLGGFTEAKLKDPKFTLTTGGSSNSSSLELPTFRGFTLGGGFEERLSGNLSMRAEYRYTKLGSQTIFSQPDVVFVDLDPAIHSVRFALTYRFDGYDWSGKPH
jgi:outer membrane immunogenic protein